MGAVGYNPERRLRDPAKQLNRHLHRLTGDNSWFATCFYGEWDRAERTLHYVNAGHPWPIVRGSLRGQPLDQGGPPLGAFLTSQFDVGKVLVQPGATTPCTWAIPAAEY